MDLLAMQPRGDLTSTGYSLANPGREYLVLRPEDSTAFTVALVPGTYQTRWFSITGRVWQTAPKVTAVGTTRVTFTSPFRTPGPIALHLKREPYR